MPDDGNGTPARGGADQGEAGVGAIAKLIAKKQKSSYDTRHASNRQDRIEAVLDGRGGLPGDGPDGEKFAQHRFFRELACKALKSHDSWVDKGAEFGAERVPNVAERVLNVC